MKHLPWVAFVLISIISGPSASIADDHIVEGFIRTYMGRTTPEQSREYWISDQALYSNFGQVVIIERHDLDKKWTLYPAAKRYMEEPLNQSGQDESDSPRRIQEFGFNYEPEFDWLASRTKQDTLINGWKCQQWILDGDADYATEYREICATGEAPINMARYWKLMREPDLSPGQRDLYEKEPELGQMLFTRVKIVKENAIAPVMVYDFKVKTAEQSAPPEGIYEVPAGFECVSTRDELFAR